MKLNIKTKLIGGFLIVAALLIGVFGISYVGLNTMGSNTKIVFTQSQEDFQWARMQGYINREISMTLGYPLTGKDSFIQGAQQQGVLADECVKQLDILVPAERRDLYNKIVAEKSSVESMITQYLDTCKTKGNDAGSALLPPLAAANTQLANDGTEAINASHAATLAVMEASESSQKTSTMFMISIAAMALLIAVGLGLLLSRSISNGIKKVNHALKKMSSSDLTERVIIKSSDEIGEMARSYNELLDERIRVVKSTRDTAFQLTTAGEQLATAAQQSSQATQQVATSSQQMAKGAQDQSTSAQETAKSVKQLSEVINQIASRASEQSAEVRKSVTSITEVSENMVEAVQHATQATQGANQAAESATMGVEKAKLTLSGMEKIKLSSDKVAKTIEELGARSTEIGKIVAVIDDIAAQTNLLALNAAIEAARAGDQGRGFAVVSDEVRKLAERTATATKEIADLIGNVQKGVNEATQATKEGNTAVADGYNMAVQAGQALEQILKASADVNVEVEQISAKAKQVNTSINNLVKVIDNVGNITEENNAATEEMSANATQVSRAVETVAGIAEENSAATEEVSASAEEMNAQIEEIVASSESLKDIAKSLEKSMAAYKLSSNDNENTATKEENISKRR